jgi:hypothetical protein
MTFSTSKLINPYQLLLLIAHIQRMLDLISDGPYEEINFNPLDNLIKAVKTTFNITVKLKFNIELEGKWMVSNPKVPRIYGAPKTHKPGKKLRPKTSNIYVPSEIVAKRLKYQFKQFPGPSGFYVENTQDAIKKLQDIKIEDDECMVSFDVTALLPNVPIEDALSLLKKWLKQHITDMDSVNLYVKLTKMCMQDNYKRSVLVWGTPYHRSWRIFSWLIRQRYILRYEEEYNRLAARDNEPTSQYDQIHT